MDMWNIIPQDNITLAYKVGPPRSLMYLACTDFQFTPALLSFRPTIQSPDIPRQDLGVSVPIANFLQPRIPLYHVHHNWYQRWNSSLVDSRGCFSVYPSSLGVDRMGNVGKGPMYRLRQINGCQCSGQHYC